MRYLNKVAALVVAVFLGTGGVAVGLDGQFVDVKLIPGELNSPAGDWSPTVTEDGLLLMFSSNRTGPGQWQLYAASREATNQPFGPVRTIDHDILTFTFDPLVTPDGRKLYFSSSFDLYCATRDDRSDEFGPAQPLTDLNTEQLEAGPSVTHDGKTIVFHRTPDFTAGSRDLYEAWWSEGRYHVRELEEINLDGYDESNSGISRDGLTLFFGQQSFPRRPGSTQGGVDIWYCTRTRLFEEDGSRSKFSEPKPLPPPVNSFQNDMSPQPSYDWPRDGSKLYFVRGSGGADDLFEATWRSASCPSGLRGERVDTDAVRLTWTNGDILPSSVDIFRDEVLIADDAPADPPEYDDAPATRGLHSYRLEYLVAGTECIDLTTQVNNTPRCAHCSGMTTELIDMAGANVRVTVEASDDTSDQLAYSLVARRGEVTVAAGLQAANVFDLELEPGGWTITATVTDESTCNPPQEDDECTRTLTVPPPCDTHCRSLDVQFVDGSRSKIRATATADDDTGGFIIYLFEADDGAGYVEQVGPQLQNVADFSLPPGDYTISVTVSDDSACHGDAIDATCTRQISLGGRFTRGDANADDTTDIADPVFVLNYLFGGGRAPTCLQTADANDDNAVDIADPTYELNHLFAGGAPLPPPVGGCGTDPTPAENAADNLSCEAYAPCAP